MGGEKGRGVVVLVVVVIEVAGREGVAAAEVVGIFNRYVRSAVGLAGKKTKSSYHKPG